MSKLEEKIYDKISDYFDWCQKSKDCTKVVLEITEQECIGFKRFCDNLSEDEKYNESDGDLFQLYQKSKEN